MILAGHETTATALFWSLYLLALDPDDPGRRWPPRSQRAPSTARSNWSG